MREEKNPWNPPPEREGNLDLIKVWDWISGKKRRKLREWLADNRKSRRQALHYKEKEDV